MLHSLTERQHAMVTAMKEDLIPEAFREIALQRPLDADDLRGFPDDDKRYEIIGGQLVVSPSPTYRHQRVSFKLTSVLDRYLSASCGAQAVAAPMDVHLSPNDVVQPDLLVVLDQRTGIIQDRGIMGAPDLVIEILSPASIENDFLRKSKLYERAGVREYWIVNPDGETVSVQTLEGDRYVLTGEYGRDDTLRSAVLEGFELELATIFPKPAKEANPAKETESTNDE